ADSSKFKKFKNLFPNNLVDNVTEQFNNIFDKHRLSNELSVIYSDSQFNNLNIPEILKIFVDNDLSDIFPEAFKLFVLIATIPATSVTVKQNFSRLKRIKTYLRNSMSQNRLMSLALMSIEKELLISLYKKDNFVDLV